MDEFVLCHLDTQEGGEVDFGITDVQLAADAAAVGFDGVQRDVQKSGDLWAG
ncbi:unnamed protein product [marine sediment metagenome]|uniref:Uncharacterized protein n=1 Tax=marine sediment metagenome TaxID=412755 RepID=X0X991_9ZZZZ